MADEPEATESKPSLDEAMQDSMSAVFDQIEAREKADHGPADTKIEPSPPASPADGPARDATGKFAPKAAPAAAAPKIPDQAQTAAPGTHQGRASAPDASTEPPQSWSADVRGKWATLPPDIQAYIAKREGEVHGQITQTGERLKSFENLQRVLEPRLANLVSQFGSPERGIETLLNLAEVAERDFPGFVREQARLRGIDLASLVPAASPQMQVDPQLAPLYTEINSLKQAIAQQRAAETAAQQAAIDSEISGFAKDHPHLESVRSLMGSLIQSGQAKGLEDAYEQAVYANPQTRAAILAEQAAKDREKAEQEAKQRAAEAQRHRAINVTTKGRGVSPTSRGGTLDQRLDASLTEAYDRMNGAA